MQTRITEFEEAGARIVAVSPDTPEENSGVVERLGLDFPILSDDRLELTKALGLLHEGGGPGGFDIPRPAIFIVDDDRRILCDTRTRTLEAESEFGVFTKVDSA